LAICWGDEYIKNDTHLVKIDFAYNTFKQKAFQASNYRSWIEFQFGYTKYRVIDSMSHISIEKLYSEQLTSEEIIELVNAEIKLHKNHIEKQIDEIRNPK
jgi:hypothetical protein